MTRQWRKEKQSELAKPGFVWTYAHYFNLFNPDFSFTLQSRSAPVWGSHVFFNLEPQITRWHIYIRQYTINGRTVSSVIVGGLPSGGKRKMVFRGLPLGIYFLKKN
jgi:hypothetical protein